MAKPNCVSHIIQVVSTEVDLFMVDFIVLGGPVMIPLLFCSVLAVAIGLERIWYFAKTRSDTADLMEEVRASLDEGRPLEAIHFLKKQPGPVASVLAASLAFSDRSPSEIRERVAQIGQEEVAKLERRLPILDTIITISPLLGILGTVTGIIGSFQVMSSLEGVTSPQALSGGIAEALITTATGLIIAIPTLALYNWLSSIVDRRVLEMNRCSEELIDLIAHEEGV